MASPAPISQTTLSLLVKQLQYFSQEIGALQQQRVSAAHRAEAVAEDQQLQIAALEAQLSSHISKNTERLDSIEALLAKPTEAAKGDGDSHHVSAMLVHARNAAASYPSSSTMMHSSSSSAAAATSSFYDSHAATVVPRTKRACSPTSFRREDSTSLSSHDSSYSSAAPQTSRHRSTALYRGISYDEASSDSDVDRDCDNKEEVDGEDGDDKGGERGGKDSVAMSKLTAAPSSAATVAVAPASATGGGTTTVTALISQAASAAWTAAIAAARARITLIATIEATKSCADEARGALSSVVKQAATSTLSITAAVSRLADAMSAVTSSGISVGQLKRRKLDTDDPVIRLR